MITCTIQPAHLLGRRADALVADLLDETMRAEMFAIDDALHAQAAACSLTLASSRHRALAVDLVATASALCVDVAEVTALVRVAHDWLADLGDLAAAAQAHQSLVDAAIAVEDCLDLADDGDLTDALTVDELAVIARADASYARTSRLLGLLGGTLHFQIDDADTLIVSTRCTRHGVVVLGQINLGRDRRSAAPAPVPELVA